MAIKSQKQVENTQKASLIFSLKPIFGSIYLEIKNTGQRPAYEISFTMNDEFMDCIKDNLKIQFEGVRKNPFRLSGGDQKLFYIMPMDESKTIGSLSQKNVELEINLIISKSIS